MSIRTYKRKLILNKAQEERISSWIGACRVVYNLGLEIRKAAYHSKQESVHKYELMKQVTTIRDIPWIRDVSVECLQNSIERLDKAYNNFFRTFRLGGGFPKFAAKKRFKSISFKTVKIANNCIVVQKLGALKTFKDEKITGIPKTATIILEPAGFFICIQCKEVPKRFDSENQAIGLDMGISHFCIDSNGNFTSNPKHFKKYERQLRIENRALARKKRGSNGWKKQCKRLSLLHHKIANVRKDFLHKESTQIAKSCSTVFIEDLNITGMAKNHNLSKHILDCGWSMFRVMLEYKTEVVRVNPKYTSQECSECGNVDAENRKSQAEFICTNCGHVANADVNAAKNIMSRGTAFIRQREAIA